jgi:hypothetical protein
VGNAQHLLLPQRNENSDTLLFKDEYQNRYISVINLGHNTVKYSQPLHFSYNSCFLSFTVKGDYFLHDINRLVFMMVNVGVYCEVGTSF